MNTIECILSCIMYTVHTVMHNEHHRVHTVMHNKHMHLCIRYCCLSLAYQLTWTDKATGILCELCQY